MPTRQGKRWNVTVTLTDDLMEAVEAFCKAEERGQSWTIGKCIEIAMPDLKARYSEQKQPAD